MKIEHESSPRSNGHGLVTPLYKTVPKLDDGRPISHREFTKWYGLSLERLCLKRIRILRNKLWRRSKSILDLSKTKMVTIMSSKRS